MNCVERVRAICSDRKIPISRLERDLGFSNGYIAQLRKGVFPADRLAMIAEYFGVTTDFLLTGNEKAPTPEDEREIGFDDFTYAFYKESKDLPEEKKKMLLDMARFMKADMEKEKG